VNFICGISTRITKRKFTAMTADLLVLADWLGEHGITRVGMESTADYWRPVLYLLEHRFDCWLLNARHMRAVPGRKTDAEWICDLDRSGRADRAPDRHRRSAQPKMSHMRHDRWTIRVPAPPY
jgi:transposase